MGMKFHSKSEGDLHLRDDALGGDHMVAVFQYPDGVSPAYFQNQAAEII